MNKRILGTVVLGAVFSALVLNGCGGETAPPTTTPNTSVIASAARNMEQDDDRDDDDRDRDDGDRERTYMDRFVAVVDALRAVPALAPLFEKYRVPRLVEYDEDDEDGADDEDDNRLVLLLRAVRISVSSGTVTITNRQTGSVIFTARLDALAAGVFYPENMPGGTGLPPPPPVACAYDYSEWSACQSGNTQTRTMTSSSPPGCTGTPVTSRSCTYVPPVTTCSAFTYSAWGTCQSNDTQTRTVTSSSPAGCTGGTPVTSQSCTYVPPTCTYTYSAWSTCSTSGTQTRTVVSSSPSGCAGTPVLSQACTPPPASCGTCHSIPPATGRHSTHSSRATCGTCHGSGYSTTTTNAATHMNGVKDVASSAGWNATAGTCANACHGSRSW